MARIEFKGRLTFVRLGNFELPVPAVTVQREKYGCGTKRVNSLVDARFWIHVPYPYGIQRCVLDTEA